MKEAKNEIFIILLVSVACIGLTGESFLMGWEFWVPPLIIIGTISLWVMYIAQKPEFSVRKPYYFVFAMLAVLFHGVHETSFFDVSLVVILVMVGFSLFDSLYMMNTILVEFFIIMAIQFRLAANGSGIMADPLTVSRIALHMAIVILSYVCSVRAINNRLESYEQDGLKDAKLEANESDMEDFLSNISHELRTPVNVVNGMSDLLLKKESGEEVYSIKSAAIRLAYQIEDIQDYTECKRNKLILEEEEYMSTSLINDVVAAFRLIDNHKNLELIVDLSPTVPDRLKGDIKKLHKIFRHLLENAVKFTRKGGIYVKMLTEETEAGLNLCIEMTDTGIGMRRKEIASVTEGMYQVNKKRNRSSGGIGLGLFIVYGFAHEMGGFVRIESEKNNGTTVRVTIPQKVVKETPCLLLREDYSGDILFHVRSDKYLVPRVRDFYRAMAVNLATGIHASLYPAETINDIERMMEKLNVRYIFMGQEEYEDHPDFFDELSKGDVVVAVSAAPGFKPRAGSRVMVMPKPLYGYPVMKILNEGLAASEIDYTDEVEKPELKGVRALIVDDEPMNLVVASGLFKDYGMVIETAASGKESIQKFRNKDYDVIFMDHMMPEMDGVEAMKHLREVSSETGRAVKIVALTANAVSGAREMFIREGFDGFIAKPIHIPDFERVMLQVIPHLSVRGGDRA